MRQNRRQFMKSTLAAVAAAGTARLAPAAEVPKAPLPLEGSRFLTFNSVIRVNQIEAGRDQLIGNDEADLHSPETARQFRAAFERGWPGGRMTWAFSWCALQDRRDNYKALREFAVECLHKYGDDITFIPGGVLREHVQHARAGQRRSARRAADGLGHGGRWTPPAERCRPVIFRRTICVTWPKRRAFMSARATSGASMPSTTATRDGSVCYPYYPSREHFCKPAQGAGDFIDCVNLDGWTMDFVSARRAGCDEKHNSRMGLGPIETFMRLGPDTGMKEVMATTGAHFDAGFELNKFAGVTTCWELSLFDLDGGKNKKVLLGCLPQWLEQTRKRWPESRCVTQGEYGNAWRAAHRDNAGPELPVRAAGGTGIFGSDENLEMRWFMNRDFRLALLRDWKVNGPETAIDFTRYDLKAEEPKDKGRNWSLMNRLNQKGVRQQDTPVALRDLNDEERSLIKRRCPELL